ncbi:MAG: hypothetical protein O2895_01915 [Chloroflexi bacterium]|nr:hypothetical protein [Chloroflexota bacterium]
MAATKHGAQRERTAGRIEQAIIDFALLGFTPVQIHRELPAALRKLAESEGGGSWKVPSLRTVQRIAARARPADPSEPWSIEDSSPEDARVVLDFLAEVIEGTQGRIREVTREEAVWIVRLRCLAPPLSFAETLLLSALYRERRGAGKPTDDLDAYLAFAPWRGRGEAASYYRAFLGGVIRPAPRWLVLTVPISDWFGMQVALAHDTTSWQEEAFSPRSTVWVVTLPADSSDPGTRVVSSEMLATMLGRIADEGADDES